MLQAARVWEGRGSFGSLASKRVRGTIQDEIRRQTGRRRDQYRRPPISLEALLEEGFEPSIQACDPLTAVYLVRLPAALDVLSPKQREVIWAYYWQDEPLPAISARLNIDIRAAWQRLQFAYR